MVVKREDDIKIAARPQRKFCCVQRGDFVRGKVNCKQIVSNSEVC